MQKHLKGGKWTLILDQYSLGRQHDIMQKAWALVPDSPGIKPILVNLSKLHSHSKTLLPHL